MPRAKEIDHLIYGVTKSLYLFIIIGPLACSSPDDDMKKDSNDADTTETGNNPGETDLKASVLFEDNFDWEDSYFKELTMNATYKEYGENSLKEGHLLKKWLYNWEYSYEGDWTQAFYVVPDGADYMEQAGRSGGSNYVVMANEKIPDDVKKYEIEFRQRKNDNDKLFYHLGTDKTGEEGIRFGYMNQEPGTDNTVDMVYIEGDLGEATIKGRSYFRQWVDHKISVDIGTKQVRWEVDGTLLHTGKAESLTSGGYFGISMSYERGTRFDDVKITTYK